jgi:hypothetical protein
MNTDPLKSTTPDLQRFWVHVVTTEQWYAVMHECRAWFGKNWQCQGKVRKKLNSNSGSQYFRHSSPWAKQPSAVWFDVPDARWATWVATKLSLQVVADSKNQTGK